ncbi:MAG: transposase [Selenomonadales bacterium]|nr:transposase [Selenomonadales bacterium]
MSKDHAKNNYRDSLFRKYFEHPDKLAALHELLTGIPTAEQNVEIKTLKSVLFNRLKNDISFKVGDRFIVLFEHQSTINPNMPERMLLYSAMLYRKMLSKESIYSKKLIQLPAPEFYVLYNGKEPWTDNSKLYLSSAFAENQHNLELVVTVRNIRYNKDNELLQKYKPLNDYSFFVYDVEKRVASGDSLADAIRSATDYYINHNIMRDYLSANYEEVFEMMSLRWNEKDAKKYWQKEAREEGHAAGLVEGRAQGLSQGHAQGLSQGLVKGRMSATIAFIKNLISMRMPYSDIAKATNTSIEDVQRIAKDNGLSL